MSVGGGRRVAHSTNVIGESDHFAIDAASTGCRGLPDGEAAVAIALSIAVGARGDGLQAGREEVYIYVYRKRFSYRTVLPVEVLLLLSHHLYAPAARR